MGWMAWTTWSHRQNQKKSTFSSRTSCYRMRSAVLPGMFFSVNFDGNLLEKLCSSMLLRELRSPSRCLCQWSSKAAFSKIRLPCFRVGFRCYARHLLRWTLKAIFSEGSAVPCFRMSSAGLPGTLFNGLRRQPFPQTPQFHASA